MGAILAVVVIIGCLTGIYRAVYQLGYSEGFKEGQDFLSFPGMLGEILHAVNSEEEADDEENVARLHLQ